MTFEAFPKIKRLSRECVVTEKIDGTNASVFIDPSMTATDAPPVASAGDFYLWAGSRSRWISPGKSTDNFSFAAWVRDNAEQLVTLGVGRHYGEWWGHGIQRGYGQTRKRFSLFNAERWGDTRPECCDVVPVLYRGNFETTAVDYALDSLRVDGSRAAPGFMQPEGVIVYHTAARTMFKKTLEGDQHKDAA